MRIVSENVHSDAELCGVDWDDSSSAETNVHNNSSCLDSLLSEIDPHILTNEIPDAFEQFVRALPKSLELRRAGFVLAHQGHVVADTSQLALTIIAISDREIVRSGLGVSIPRENSALYEICNSHCLKTITPADDFRGNFVERHALVVSANGSLGMYPLAIDQFSLGAVTLNCDSQAPFNDYSEQLHCILEKFKLSVAEIVSKISTASQTTPSPDLTTR